MMLANDYDYFDYNSSQDSSEIEYQIDLFESRQYFKCRKSKQKIKKSSCSISLKTLKSQPILIKNKCMSYKKTPKAEQKLFRYNHYPQEEEEEKFECDEQFQVSNKSISIESNCSKKLEDEHFDNFSNFRRHFYHVNHQKIKSSLENFSNIKITDILIASVNESVQKNFMKTLKQNNSYFPQLVYHGTKLKNIQSILQYGFLIPNQAHPINDEAPIIVSENGRSFGTGIYCSQTAIYSLSYVHTTNTLLVCAAIPKRKKDGKMERCHGNILVLSDVTRIIPLFLVNFKYLNLSGINRPWFSVREELKTDKETNREKSVVISRKYLRKVLYYMNDQVRKNNQYQIRMFDSFN